MVALSNCMVIGDRRKYLAMVVSLKCEMDLETGASTDKLAADSLFVGKAVRTVCVAHVAVDSVRYLTINNFVRLR